MFYVKKNLYDINEPEIISKHRTIEAANNRKDEEERRHNLHLSSFGFESDGTKFYIEEY